MREKGYAKFSVTQSHTVPVTALHWKQKVWNRREERFGSLESKSSLYSQQSGIKFFTLAQNYVCGCAVSGDLATFTNYTDS